MDLDLPLLGSKLYRYREQFQATLAEVSTATGIPESALAAFEQGKAQPTGDQIELWPRPLRLGQPLPVLPLAPRNAGVVPVDLEETYSEAREWSQLG